MMRGISQAATKRRRALDQRKDCPEDQCPENDCASEDHPVAHSVRRLLLLESANILSEVRPNEFRILCRERQLQLRLAGKLRDTAALRSALLRVSETPRLGGALARFLSADRSPWHARQCVESLRDDGAHQPESLTGVAAKITDQLEEFLALDMLGNSRDAEGFT